MKIQDWKRLRIETHIKNIAIQYEKIKNGFLNSNTINEYYDDPRVMIGIEKIKKELISLKLKIEKYEKSSGLDKVKV